MKKADIAKTLKAFPYDASEYWLITGGAMVLYGIREETNDIDLGCTGKLADRLEADGYLHAVMANGKRWLKVGSAIELFEDWLYDTTTLVDGIPVISIRGLLEMKRSLGRETDIKDVEWIEAYLQTASGRAHAEPSGAGDAASVTVPPKARPSRS